MPSTDDQPPIATVTFRAVRSSALVLALKAYALTLHFRTWEWWVEVGGNTQLTIPARVIFSAIFLPMLPLLCAFAVARRWQGLAWWKIEAEWARVVKRQNEPSSATREETV